MKFNHYIIISVLSHLLFIGFLGITYSTTPTTTPIFDVNIVGPLETHKPLSPKKIKPLIKKMKPPIIKRRRRPPEKKLLPETMYGEGTGLSPQGSYNSSNAELSSKLEDHDSNKKNIESSPSTAEEHESLSSGKVAPFIVPPSSLFDKNIIQKFARKGSPAPARKGLTFDTSEFKHRGYMRMLKERIESAWKYPKEAARLGISGDLYIKFSIKKNGKLGEVELLRTSGYRDLDEAAMKALKNAGPYWPLPEDWEKDDLEIKGHFIYIYGTTYAL